MWSSRRTFRRGIGAGKVLGLVPSQKTLSLDGGSRASGQFLVEAHNTLHADGIGGGANCLEESISIPLPCALFVFQSVGELRGRRNSRIIANAIAGQLRLGEGGHVQLAKQPIYHSSASCTIFAIVVREGTEHTLGGMRVESPRFAMKLILAGWTVIRL